MNIIGKALQYCKSNGLRATSVKVLDKVGRSSKQLPLIVKELYIKQRSVRYFRKCAEGRTVYVIIPCIDWSLPLFQRPHQMAEVFSKREESLVFFLPDQYKYDNFAFSDKISDTLYLFSIRMIDSMNTILSGAKEVVVIMSWTRHIGLLDKLRYDKLIYEYIDELQLFYYYDTQMELCHQQLMKQADLTVVTADKLYKLAEPYANKLLLAENAVDYDFFANARGCPVHQRIKQKADKFSCVLGYYGSLASWFDYDLILEVAARQPQWLFILIGHDFDGTYSKILNNPMENIMYIEALPYHELPAYVSGFDIAMIPFIINEITEATSPVKLFEYMASQKPILTSNLPECRKYKSVIRYSDANDFIRKAESVNACQDTEKYLDILDREALENTWEYRCDQILAALEE